MRSGVWCAGGSDAPIESCNPWTGIYDAMFRRQRENAKSNVTAMYLICNLYSLLICNLYSLLFQMSVKVCITKYFGQKRDFLFLKRFGCTRLEVHMQAIVKAV